MACRGTKLRSRGAVVNPSEKLHVPATSYDGQIVLLERGNTVAKVKSRPVLSAIRTSTAHHFQSIR